MLHLGVKEQKLSLALNTLQGLILGYRETAFCEDKKLIWATEFTYLGIIFNINNMDTIPESNLEEKMDEI